MNHTKFEDSRREMTQRFAPHKDCNPNKRFDSFDLLRANSEERRKGIVSQKLKDWRQEIVSEICFT